MPRWIRGVLLVIVILAVTGCCGLTEPLAEFIPDPLATATPRLAPTREPRPKSKDIPEISQKPEPLPTATPVPEPLAVVQQGFGQQDRGLGYAFVIENPNPTLAVVRLSYGIAFLNADGEVVGTDTGYIQRLLPEQALGVAATKGLEEGVTVTEIEVQVGEGTFQAVDPMPGFVVDRVRVYENPYGNRVTGVITNPSPYSLTEVRVSAIPYNDDGSIIGGGFTYLNFILPESSTGVNVSLSKAGDVARVALYPNPSGLTSVGNADSLPDGASPAAVSESGFGQRGRNVGYGFLVENPNPSLAIEDARYHITAYGPAGAVLATDQGTIAWIAPDATYGVGGGLIVDEGEVVDRLEAQILTGPWVESGPDPFYAAEDVTYRPGEYTDHITGWIVNPYEETVTKLHVSGIAYDRRGRIIGGGDTYLDRVRGGHSSAVEVGLTTGSQPSHVELYANLSTISEFR